MIQSKGAVLLLCLVLAPCVRGQGGDTPGGIEALERRVSELQQVVRSLTARVAMLEAQLKNTAVTSGKAVGEPEATTTPQPQATAGTSWVVRVATNTIPDTRDLQLQVSRKRDRLAMVDRQINKERSRNQSLSFKRHDGKLIHGVDRLKESNTAIRGLERQRKQLDNQIARSERTIEQMRRSRTVTGSTGDGRPVQIQARGALAGMVSAMMPGNWYTVGGRGRDVSGTLQITVSSVAEHQHE